MATLPGHAGSRTGAACSEGAAHSAARIRLPKTSGLWSEALVHARTAEWKLLFTKSATWWVEYALSKRAKWLCFRNVKSCWANSDSRNGRST